MWQAERERLEQRLAALEKRAPESFPDAAVFAKAVTWALRYDTDLTPSDQDQLRHAVQRGNERAAALEAGWVPWARAKGRLVRAYRSQVDGSIQPYGLIIPAAYDPRKPIRLDVVLHGSTRPIGRSELRFALSFDSGDSGSAAPTADYIELHPLGRVENCYRWAGETDVFEAIESVCRRYAIDRDRIVLRGMSMGASGTWHLGLKHPDRFVALGPYCGYVDTHRFSETPGMGFVKVGPLPPHQEDALHLLDSVDYAANAGVVPAVAAMGEKDPFFQAHVIMEEALRREGLPLIQLISPGTGHVQDPATHTEQLQRIGRYTQQGLDHLPSRIRFVTWSLKYARCHWVELLGLEQHYRRTEVVLEYAGDASVVVTTCANITRFALYRPVRALTIAGQMIALPDGLDASRGLAFARQSGRWRFEGYRDALRLRGKRPGVQGPIDDAFTRRFLCVRGTGTPWNPAAQAWAEAQLKRFTYEFARYFRGELTVRDDRAVTRAERRDANLILFGDPGSNRLLAEALPSQPVRWDRATVALGRDRYPAGTHAPAWIAPSPWSEQHYLVANTGHSFHEAELNLLNYLLFPRLGDWAVFRLGAVDDIAKAGWFDENWQPAR